MSGGAAATKRLTGALLCWLAAALPGCERTDRAAEQPAGTPPPMARPQRGTARITGRVTFDGARPQPQFVAMSADPYCAKANEGAERRAPISVDASGGLADVFVYVSKGIDAPYPPPAARATLDQHACAYTPKVLGLQVGQPLEIRNSDETLHNVHALAEKGAGFNIGMPHKGMSAVRKFTAPEVLLRIKCDVHPWMAAYVGVVNHPFHAVSAADGSYEIAGLPAGGYAVSAVHYDLGGQVEQVTIGDGAVIDTNFRFSD